MLQKDIDIASILEAIKAMHPIEGDVILLLFGEKSGIDYPSLIEALNGANISFFGGIFPGIIHGGNNYESGCIIKKLKAIHAPYLIRGLEHEKIDIPSLLPLAESADIKATAFTLVDGLTKNISSCLMGLYHELGNAVNFIGGGAGSLSLVQQPCLICPEGIFQDAAIVCLLKYDVKLGVKHGWQQLEGPIVATKTDGNKVIELNWQPAFEVYKNIVEEDASKGMDDGDRINLNAENFFSIAKGYPFGIYQEGQEDIVRDPIAVNEEGELLCVGDVPENTVLNILKGDAQKLIESAEVAVESTIDQENDSERLRHTLVVDCISRTLFLEDTFSKELEVVNHHIKSTRSEVTPQGILSLGEISSYGEGTLEFFNKTIVIGTLYRDI
jgi:hypothetical protein